MKKIRLSIAAAVAVTAMVAITSCSKSGEGTKNPNPEKIQVAISFKNTNTRADGPMAVKGTNIEVKSGFICFISKENTITRVYTISDAPTAKLNLNAVQLMVATQTLKEVPGSSTSVKMFANLGIAAKEPVAGNNINEFLKNCNVKVEDQAAYTEVTCVGESPLTPGGDDSHKKAEIKLDTDVARIQITDLTFASDIPNTCKIDGIFINGYYPTMNLDKTFPPFVESFDENAYEPKTLGVFPPELKGIVYDWFDPAKDLASTVKPGAAEGVWGYNLFVSPTPQIIIKLTGATKDKPTEARFVTINGFRKADNTKIEKLEGGMIYTIGDGSLVIGPGSHDPEPGIKPIDVNVDVTPATWKETIVTPIIK